MSVMTIVPENDVETEKRLSCEFIEGCLNAFVEPYRERISSWVYELNSGHYEQGCGSLRNSDNEFCCLGVASDLYDSEAWISPRFQSLSYKYSSGSESTEIDLTDEVEVYYGINREHVFSKSDLPEYLGDKVYNIMKESKHRSIAPKDDPRFTLEWNLIELNDANVPFPVIAEVILAVPDCIFHEHTLKPLTLPV